MNSKLLPCFSLLVGGLLCFGLFATSVQAQQVSGTVTNAETGESMPGVTVVVEGTNIGTATNVDGNYQLNVPSLDETLVFSFVGYQTQTVAIDGRTTVNMELTPFVIVGEEMLVTAFGIERAARSITFSTQDVQVQSIAEAREINVVNSLQGRVAGMSVTRSSAGVGASSRVVLRGDRSLTGDSQPLYILDGVPIRGSIEDLSPDDIESINVLKGPNAAALYGSAAQNGAVVITTRRGQAGVVQVSLSNTFTVERPILPIEFQNVYGQGSGGEYDRTADTSWGPEMDGRTVEHWTPDPSRAGETYSFLPQPNNVRDVMQTGFTNATNLSANIGGERTQTMFSYTFTDAQGITRGNDLERHNVSLRITSQLTDRLSADSRLSYMRQDIDDWLQQGENLRNPYRQTYRLPRNMSTEQLRQYEWIDDTGAIRHNFVGVGGSGTGVNPYWTINNMNRTDTRERVIALASLTYNLTENLSLMGRAAYDGRQNSWERRDMNESFGSIMAGWYQVNENNSLEFNSDFLLSYTEDLTPDWSLSANVGGNYKQRRNTSFTANTGDGLIVPNFFTLSNTSLASVSRSIGSPMDIASLYSFGEIGWRDAIYLDLSGRFDWSSTLPADNRRFFYPSGGLSVILSDLIPDFPEFFSFARVRGSWARVGNSAPPFMLNRSAQFISGGKAGFLQLSSTLPNERLVPEETESFEIGTDLRFFEGRLGLDLTLYLTNTRNQLFTVALPVGSGAAEFFTNGGDVENKGIEIMLKSTPVQSAAFNWDMDVSFGLNRNMVVAIDDERPRLTISTDFLRAFRIEEGRPFGEVYSRGFLRIDDPDDPNYGAVIVDGNGVPRVEPGLNVRVANYNPDWLGGITNTFNYRNVSLSFLIDHRQGGSITSITNAIIDADGVTKRTLQGRDGGLIFGQNFFAHETAVDDDGNPNTIETDAETFWRGLGGRNTPVGEAFVESATNTRLRELTLGYNLPQSLLEGIGGISNVKVSVVGRNLFFFYRESDRLDPDNMPGTSPSVEGFDSFSPPTSRSFGANIRIDF